MSKFHLEKSIEEWKNTLWKQEGLEPGFIEELEGNLRDRIEDYLDQGHPAKRAFELAKQKSLNNPEELADEFYKVRRTKNRIPPWKRKTAFSFLPTHAKIALRKLQKRKAYTFINVLGLALGIAVSQLLWMYIQDQYSYDVHFENADRIYRVNYDLDISGQQEIYSNVARPVGPALKSFFPEIEEVSRIYGMRGLQNHYGALVVEESRIESSKVFVAEQSFLKIFKHEFIEGNIDKALTDPNSIVISETLANKLFGKTDVYGKTLQFSHNTDKVFTITGVFKSPDKNTHLPVEVLISYVPMRGDLTQWLGAHVYTYMLLNENMDIENLRAKLPLFYKEYLDKNFKDLGGTAKLVFQPLTSIHLDQEYTWEPYPHGSRNSTFVLSLSIVFLLLISCINYINLATARSTERVGEVGVRKILGSTKKTLFTQFVTESVISVFLSGVVAIFLSLVMLPVFNNLSGINLNVSSILDLKNILVILTSVLFVGILVGIYPAFYLISVRISSILKGKFSKSYEGESMRKILVLAQYTLTSILFVGMLFVYQQVRFIEAKDVGYQKDNMIVIKTPDNSELDNRLSAFKEELKRHPFVAGISNTHNALGEDANAANLLFELPDGETTNISMRRIDVDFDFVETLGLHLIQGRNFDQSRGSIEYESILINKAAVRKYGWDSVALQLRQKSRKTDNDGNHYYSQVIGVVDDFVIGPAYQNILPLFIRLNDNGQGDNTYVRLTDSQDGDILNQVKGIWHRFLPDQNFDFVYLDDQLKKQYIKEKRLLNLLAVISIIIFSVTLLGVFGLISFTTALRRKEIAIRKINGAQVKTILVLLSKRFISLIIIANILSIPVAYYFVSNWLNNYSQKIEVNFWPFAFSVASCILFTLLALSYHTVQASRANPIDAIKYE